MSAEFIEYLTLANTVKNILINTSLYGSVLVHPIGFIFNTFSIIIFARKKFSDTTMGYYNIVMAFNNNIGILFNFLKSFTYGYGNDILMWSSFNCAFIYYVSRVSVSLSSWLNVMVTLDRMIFLVYSRNFLFLKNKKILSIIIFMLFLMLALINIPNLFLFVTTTVTYSNATNQYVIASQTCGPSKNLEVLVDIIRIFVRAVVPFVLVIFGDAFLIYKFIKTKVKLKKGKISRKEITFAYSIGALSMLFIISLTPFVITLTIMNIMTQLNLMLTKAYLIVYLLYGFSLVITTYNYSFMFLVNLRYNKIFRKETIEFFREIKQRLV